MSEDATCSSGIEREDHTEIAQYCPHCGAELGREPDGLKVFECPTHGQMIVSVHTDT